MQYESISRQIIGSAILVHDQLGPGFLESVYQNAMAHELRKSELDVQCECRIQVRYDQVIVGEFVADMLVNSVILIETKAIQAVTAVHEVQLVNYLTATGIEVGLLLNFGSRRLEVRRKTRIYKKTARQDEQDLQEEKL